MDNIQNISVCFDVSLVTFHNAPADINFMSFIFDTLAKNSINVDMIAQAAPISAHTSISFTISDDDVGKVLNLIPSIREYSPDIKAVVSNGNSKISVYGEFMRDQYGVAAKVFKAASSVGADIRLVTTSEVDISLLITKDQENAVEQAIRNAF